MTENTTNTADRSRRIPYGAPYGVNGRELDVEFVRVGYDVEKATKANKATDTPDEFEAMLRSGTG
jgi:hypothetical protein